MKTYQEIVTENNSLYQQEALIIQTTELICTMMEDNDISKAELARKLRKTKAYVTQCLSGEQNLTLRTLADFCTALNYKLEVGSTPLNANTACVHRLYPVGGWAHEHAKKHNVLMDVAGVGESDMMEGELCDAA